MLFGTNIVLNDIEFMANRITINVNDIVLGTSLNADGYKLYLAISGAFENGKDVLLSFKDCQPLSSSFLNSSIGELSENFGFETIKARIKVTEITKSNLNQLKKYMADIKDLV